MLKMKPQSKSRSACKSAICIARLLNTEGFSDHTASEVKRYALKAIATPEQRRRWKKIRKAWSDLAKEKLTDGDKLIVGRFIAVLQRMSFDTGLRIGMTAFINGAQVPCPSCLDGLGEQEVEAS